MNLILHVFSGGPDDRAECDYALVALTQEHAQAILARVERFIQWRAADPELIALRVQDESVRFFSTPDDPEIAAWFERQTDEWFELPDGLHIPAAAFQETEPVELVVGACQGEVWVGWRAYPTGLEWDVFTSTLSPEFFERVAAAASVT